MEKNNDTNDNSKKCGGCGKYPRFLKRFASPRYFLVAFCLQNIIQGASTSYFVGVETSIEKHFHFSSKDFGMLIVLSEIGPITTSLILSYIGGKGNRPRWLSIGMMIAALGLLLTYTTYFIYPPPTITESGELSDSKKYCTIKGVEPDGGGAEELQSKGNFSQAHNVKNCYESNVFVFYVWFISYAFLGTGSMVVYCVGGPYLDDSIKKNDSPLYFAIIIAVKIMGPFVGFAVSAGFLQFYVIPGENHGITSMDPRWIGAWWGGTLLFSFLNALFGLVIGLFPRNMNIVTTSKSDPVKGQYSCDLVPPFHDLVEYGSIPSPNNSSVHPVREGQASNNGKLDKARTSGFSSALMRIMRNRTLLLTSLTDVFAITGILGFFLWLPKYLEHQFRINKAEASLYTGLAGTSSVIIGILGGGLFIRQCQPTAKTLVVICAICKAIYIASLIGLMFITCNFNDDLPGNYDTENGILRVDEPCSSECHCNLKEFIPVCVTEGDEKGRSFFSPCHVGCPNPLGGANYSHTPEEFYNCSCASSLSTVSLGFCRKTCSAFTAYNLVNVIIKSFISVGAIGNFLINLRCVDPQDKAISLGLKGTMIALGLLVAPLLFGALADSSCILWEEACGTKGSCWVYDTQDFGYKLHGASVILFFISLICDIILSQNVSHVTLMDSTPALRTSASSASPSNLSSNEENSLKGSRKQPVLSSLRRSIFKPQTVGNNESKNGYSNNISGILEPVTENNQPEEKR